MLGVSPVMISNGVRPSAYLDMFAHSYIFSLTYPREAIVPQLGRYLLLEHQSVLPFLEFMDPLLGWILVWPSRSGDMVLHFVSSNRIHETSLGGSGLNWCTIESESFWDTIIANKLR